MATPLSRLSALARSAFGRPGLSPLALAAACSLGAFGCGFGGSGGSAGSTSGGGGGAVVSNANVDWRDEVIYQVLTDRFADGDVNNNWNVDRSALARYQGGDWEGILDRADYLKALGVTAVWISPIVKNVEIDAGVSGYHGYWTQDFLGVNPHFGDLRALKRMVDGLHAHGIKVILDIVTNHIGPLFYYDINLNGQPDIATYGSGAPGSPVKHVTEYDPDWDASGIRVHVGHQVQGPAPVRWLNMPADNRVPIQPAEFQNPDWYNRRGKVVPDANGNWPVDQTLLGDFPGGLKDLATHRQDVRDALVRVFGTWIERIDFDGFRIDTVKHVEHSFWSDFAPRIRQIATSRGKHNFLQFGEAFDGDDGVCASYTQHDMLDSVFYFPQKYAAVDGVIKYGGPTATIEALWGRKSMYGQAPQPGGIGVAPARALVNFVDNHDVPRFQFGEAPGDYRKLKVALGFILASEGIPCLYYGTEQGFTGGGDPGNRERLWDSGYNTAHPLFTFTRRLIDIRKAHAPIRRGDTQIRWATTRTGAEEDAGIFAFERSLGAEAVLYVMNVHASKASRTSVNGARMTTSFAQGTVLEDLLDASFSATVDVRGEVSIEVPAISQRILVAR